MLTKKEKICRTIIDYGILGLLVFSPLPAASVNQWSIYIIQICVLVMLAAYLVMDKGAVNQFPVIEALKWPKVLFSALFVLIIIQVVPFPLFLVKILSPNAYVFQSQFLPGFEKINFISLSLIPAHTLRQGLEFVSYFILGFLVIRTVKERKQIMRIFSVIVAMGAFEAVYGLLELYNKNPRILFYEKLYNLDSACGTFVNRNHFSGYLEMIIPLAIGLFIARIDLFAMTDLKLRDKIIMLSRKNLSTQLLMAMGIIIMSIAVIFSKSRSGIFILFFCFILMYFVSVLNIGKFKSQNIWMKRFIVIIFLVIIFISLRVGIGASLDRFAMDNLLREGRPLFWANTLKMFTEYPLLGTGLGTFPALYRDWEFDGSLIRLYHAHNDYLEFLTELGILGFILLLGGIAIMVVSAYLAWRIRKDPQIKGLALGGLVAVLCMGIHSFTDFNLHIPANLILFTVVLSLTSGIAFYKHNNIR